MRIPSLALLGLSALLVSGCQSLFGNSNRLAIARSVKAVGATAEPHAELARGRQALEEGRFAEAIAAFSSLRRDSALAGEAFNGLAIAYAGLGRPDLAERFFQQAIASDPGDRRFHRNLARFFAGHPASSYRVAHRIEDASGAGASAANEVVAQAGTVFRGDHARATVRVDAPSQGIVRLSPREVIVRSSSSEGKAVMAPTDPRQALASGRRLNPHYPARAAIPGIEATGGTAGYPVRMSLTKNDQ